MRFRFRNFRLGKTVEFHEVLPDIIKEFDVNDSFIIIQLKRYWEEITGDIISAHSTPERINGKKIFVSVDHPVYANEISLMKNSLLDRINYILGSELVNDIRAEVRKSRWKKQDT